MKILHLDENHFSLKEELSLLGCENDEDYTSSREKIMFNLLDYEGIIIRSRFKIDREFIDKAVNLRFIARVGSGLEHIDCDYAQSKGIFIFSAPEGNSNAVGEHAMGMILSLFRNIKKSDTEVREGKWLREENRGIELEGKVIGLIGYGNTGKSFGKKLSAFDCEVICFDLKDNVGDENARQVDLNELQEKSDIISMHTCSNEKSHKMINRNFIDKVRKSFYFINTARGSVVMTDDMVSALKSGKIRGACLDVLEYEDISSNFIFEKRDRSQDFQYLISSEKVLFSPHIAGVTRESHFKLAKIITEKIAEKFSLR